MQYTRLSNETDEELIYRICSQKDIIGTWNAVADILNSIIGVDMDESTYRKKYSKLKNVPSCCPAKLPEELNLEKEKIKIRDERNELRRLIREQARRESYRDQIIRSLSSFPGVQLDYQPRLQFEYASAENDMIISLFDLHAGLEVHNHVNDFDSNVLADRLHQYLDKICSVALLHKPEKGYVILSELLSGIIHPTLRIENNQDLIEQFLSVTDYVAQFLVELGQIFKEVHVYMAPGNHSRISPNKEESLAHENMDNLALPFLEAKLQNYHNIFCHKNEVEQSIAIFSVRDNLVVSSHGDKETPANAIQRLTLFLGQQPDLYYCGHMHTNALTTVTNSKVIQSGCMSGSDSFCMDKRLANSPEQTLSIITSEGLDCLYDVTLK